MFLSKKINRLNFKLNKRISKCIFIIADQNFCTLFFQNRVQYFSINNELENMKAILISLLSLIFIETNGQNGVAIKQRIQDIEIRGKATTITTKGSTTCHGYGDYMNDEIVFVDEGEEHIYIDSVTIVDLQKAYSIISSNMLTGFYGDIKIDFHPEFSGLIEGNIYFDSEEIERISSSITLPSEQFDFNKSQIALFDSTTMAFMIGSQFARLCFAVATKNDTYFQQNYSELGQVLSHTSFEISSIPAKELNNQDKIRFLKLQFEEVQGIGNRNAFYATLGCHIESNKIMLDSYILHSERIKEKPLIEQMIGGQLFDVERFYLIVSPNELKKLYISPSLNKTNSQLAKDLEHMANIYWGKE
ncbi:MAG: hypothetical protein ACI85I_002484 [Arenicella sp.]|jgi:hypothetical protein